MDNSNTCRRIKLTSGWWIFVKGVFDIVITVAQDEESFNATTIKRLKEMVLEHCGLSTLSVDDIRLVHGGRQLEINTSSKELTLRDYGIGRDATVACVMRLQGGGAGKHNARHILLEFQKNK